MGKVRLDFYLGLGAELSKGDVHTTLFGCESVINDEYSVKYYSKTSNRGDKRFITSFTERENKGVQPVPDGFPVVALYKSGMETKKVANLYSWSLYGGKGEIKSWKPDREKLLEMQKEHDAKQEKPIEELMINAKESKMSKNNKHSHHDLIVEWAKDTSIKYQFLEQGEEWDDCDDDGPIWSVDVKYRRKPREFQKGHWYPCIDNDGDFSVRFFNGDVFSAFAGFDCGTERDDMKWIGESLGEIKFGGEE